MSEQKSTRSDFFTKYKIIVFDEETLGQKAQYRLSKSHVVFYSVFLFVLGIVLFWVLLAFTPLKKLFQETSLEQMTSKQEAGELAKKVISLERQIEANNKYINSLRQILKGENVELPDLDIPQTNETAEKVKKNFLFTPVKGVLTGKFDPSKNHFAIDIAAKKGDAVMACDDGVVIFSEWSATTGYVLIILHSGNRVSIYKHNSISYKKQGDRVKMGEAIAAVGNTGELTTGPHLHFEYWIDGKPVNPRDYLNL